MENSGKLEPDRFRVAKSAKSGDFQPCTTSDPNEMDERQYDLLHSLPNTFFGSMHYADVAKYLKRRRALNGRLLIMPTEAGMPSDPSPAQAADIITRRKLSEYTWSTSFHPSFIRDLTFEGFLCISSELAGSSNSPLYVLVPKLHHMRCVIDLSQNKLHISKNIRKQSKKYWITFNRDFEQVVLGCIEQHGENWLYPPMRCALKDLRRDCKSGGSLEPTTFRALSIEIWRGDFNDEASWELVAGELGIAYGSVYLSLTGYYNHAVSGAGSVQLGALGAALKEAGVLLWDMGQGQGTEYKYDYGAVDVPRADFLQLQRAHRNNDFWLLNPPPRVQLASVVIEKYQIHIKTRSNNINISQTS